jgi:hypothetical protein
MTLLRRGVRAFIAFLISVPLLANQAARRPDAAPAAAAGSRPSSGFEVGQIFPEILLPAAEDGRPLSISRSRGRKVLLHIFASW